MFGKTEQTTFDRAAVDALYEEALQPGTKGLPLSAPPATLGELAGCGLDALDDPFPRPSLVLRQAALTHNIATMADYCATHGALLAPHGKTTMAPQLFARQIDAGAWAMTAATPVHVRSYRRFGIGRILLANQVVEPAAIAWIAEEMKRDPEFELLCLVDSVAGVAMLAAELRRAGAPRPLDVLLEVGDDGARSGVREVEVARSVGAAAAAATELRLRGVECFEGLAKGHDPDHTREIVDRQLERVATVAAVLATDGTCGEEPLVSAGGSAFFDRVVAILGDLPGRLVLRSGCYVTQDGGFYAANSPLGEHRSGDGERLRDAIELWSVVLSRPEPELAVTSMGKRDAPYDLGLPTVTGCRGRDGTERPLEAAVIALSDQHAHLRVGAHEELEVGELVRCSISHPCGAFDRWPVIPVLDEDDRIVDAIRTFF
jgi:D-serine deaminase-like pyridoxal phosphate-dependent protein